MAIKLNKKGLPYNDKTGNFVSWGNAFKSSNFRKTYKKHTTKIKKLRKKQFEEERFIEEQIFAEKLFLKPKKKKPKKKKLIDLDEKFIQEQIKAEKLELGIPIKPDDEWDIFIDIWESYIDDFDLDEDEIGAS